MNYRDTIAARLRELRRIKSAKDDRDVSRREVAEAIGVSVASVSNWESGTTAVDLEDAWKLADYYGVTMGELAGRTAFEPVA